MPIQVNEIVIRAIVEGGESQRSTTETPSQQERQELVADCVEQVLEILKNRQER